MITKLTSIKSVIAKIIADLDIKEDDSKIKYPILPKNKVLFFLKAENCLLSNSF